MLAHHIRPHKGKPYVTNLFPNLINIADRNEESVHETLAISLPKILKVLSCFTTESEMKVKYYGSSYVLFHYCFVGFAKSILKKYRK